MTTFYLPPRKWLLSTKAIVFLFLISFFSNCGPKLKNYTTKYCDLTVHDFLKNCYKTASGTNFIDYKMTIKTYSLQTNSLGTSSTPLFDTVYNSTSSAIKQPVTVRIRIADQVPYRIEITIESTDCSRCANNMFGAQSPYDPCTETIDAAGWHDGKPKFFVSGDLYTYQSAISTTVPQTKNVSGSCGCLVTP